MRASDLCFAIIVCGSAALLCAADEEGAPPIEESFVQFQQSRLFEKLLAKGPDVDLSADVARIGERHQKLFGSPLSRESYELLARRTTLSAVPDRFREVFEARGKIRPDDIPELFVAEERIDLYEKAVKGGEKFDPHALVHKLSDEYERKFQAPIPDRFRASFQTAVDWGARYRESGNGERPAPQTVVSSPGSIPPRPALTQMPLPSWFSERDRDGDGQIGLYEWPIPQRADFATWDLNQDGYIGQGEVQSVLARPR